MPAVEFVCKVVEKVWLTPTVISLRFAPSRRVRFEAGQFVSVIVPEGFDPTSLGIKSCSDFVSQASRFPLPERVRRLYSFAGSPDDPVLELCVKVVAGGAGSSYVASLEVGDLFRASAPFGDFYYRPGSPQRRVCFISTGTGIAPFKSMVTSKLWRENRPLEAVSISGCRTVDEICYSGFFESQGVQELHAVSEAGPDWKGFTGRVTELIEKLPLNWGWQNTDFYLCGNPKMVDEVIHLLVSGRGVPAENIFHEAYFGAADWAKTAHPQAA